MENQSSAGILDLRSFTIPRRYIILTLVFLVYTYASISKTTLQTAATLLGQSNENVISNPTKNDNLANTVNRTNKVNPPGTCRSPNLIHVKPQIYKDVRDTNYGWTPDSQKQFTIFSSITLAIIQPVSGYFSDKYGGKPIASIAIIGMSVLTLVTPFTVHITNGNFIVVSLISILDGLFQGCLFPSTFSVLSHWMPPRRKSCQCCFAFTGVFVGTMIDNVCTRALMIKHRNWGVPFYIYGSIGIVISIIWLTYAASTPESCTLIDLRESLYLQTKFGSMIDHKRKEVPIFRILSSASYWVVTIAFFAQFWNWVIGEVFLKIYLMLVLKVQLTDNILWASAPYLLMCVASLASSVVSDWAIDNKHVNQRTIRKAFINAGNMGAPIYVLFGSLAKCHVNLVQTYFLIGMGLEGFSYIGIRLILTDMSPNYAGFLYGVTNGLGVIFSAVIVIILGSSTQSVPATPEGYGIILWATVGICTALNCIFVVFGRTNLKDWNTPRASKDSNKRR